MSEPILNRLNPCRLPPCAQVYFQCGESEESQMQRRLTKAATATNLESGDQKRVGVHRWEFSAGDFCFFIRGRDFTLRS